MELAHGQLSHTPSQVLLTYPQDFLPVPVKHMRCKTPVCTEHLPGHYVSHTQFPLRHIANVASLWVHNYIFVSLLEPKHYIHELQLPGHHNGGV